MKGLLLKDWYMLRKYCKSYLLITLVFMGVSLAGGDNMFFAFYPCLLAGMIPVNLLGYDERSKWISYSAVLPYTKAQLVSSKYLIGLFAQFSVLMLSGIAQAVRMYYTGTFVFNDYLLLLAMLFILCIFSSSISLPFMFKLGVEKGRIAYLVMIGFVCAGSAIAAGIFSKHLQKEITFGVSVPLFCLAGICVYALSWYLSILFYRRKEID